MPYIEENDLLNLHKEVEEAQKNSKELLHQVKDKNKVLQHIKTQRNVLLGIAILLAVGLLALVLLKIDTSGTNLLEDKHSTTVATDSLEEVKTEMDRLKAQNETLSQIEEYYLAKALLKEEKIYSVQVMAFADTKTALVSEGLTNTRFVKNNPFYSFSLGNFETLGEAQAFRKQLVAMGFEDAFVASYQYGERIRIEEPYSF